MNYGSQSWVEKVESILLKHPKDAYISQDYLNENWEFNQFVDAPLYERALEEYAVFEGIIKDHVENVYYLPQDDRTNLDSIYAHDSLKVTNKGVIYFNMIKPSRQGEGQATEDYLSSLGLPTLGHIEAPGHMDGGDVLWLDEKTACIGRSYRTNIEGINQFRELTKDFVDEVIPVPMPHADGRDHILHLTSCISMIDHDLAVVYPKYLPAFFMEILEERGIELIEVCDQEYEILGCNVLTLEPRVCVIAEGHPKVTQALRDKGCEVFTFPAYNIGYLGTGGPTCLSHTIKRG